MGSFICCSARFFAFVFILFLAGLAPATALAQSHSSASESSLEWLERIGETDSDDPVLRQEIAELKNATDPESLARLGYLYDNGHGVEQDRKLAYEQYIMPAAEGGSALGEYLNGRFRLQDHSFGSSLYPAKPWLAVELLTSSAEKGFVLAQYTLGDLNFGELIDSPDPSEGVKWLTRAADQNYYPAMYFLGHVHYQGLGVDQDTEKARSWYFKAAEGGYAPAMLTIGQLYSSEGKNHDALEWIRKSAEKGYHEGQYQLGVLYLRGNMVEQSEDQAVLWWERAANQGNYYAIFALSQYYCPTDPDLALQWLEIAVERGHRGALMEVAKLLMDMEKDLDRAIEYLEKYVYMTPQDDPTPMDAYHRLADIYESRGEDEKEFEYLHKVVESIDNYQGYAHNEAILRLADYYFEGKGGYGNHAPAEEWLRRGHGEYGGITADQIFELYHDHYPADAGGWVKWSEDVDGNEYFYHPDTYLRYERPTIDFRGFQVLVKKVRPSGGADIRGWVYDDRVTRLSVRGVLYRYETSSAGYSYRGKEGVDRKNYTNPRSPGTIQNALLVELWD